MIKLSDKARSVIKEMAVKESASNRQILWWMLWGMMLVSPHKDRMILMQYQYRYANIVYKRSFKG